MNTTDRLLRRVQRHAAFAMVLRAEAAEKLSAGPGDLFARALSSDESLVPGGQAGEARPAPLSTVPTSPTPLPAVPAALSLSPWPISSMPDAPPAMPTTGAGSEPDKTWRRLQTIFNRHKDKTAAPPETPEAPRAKPVDIPPGLDRMTYDRVDYPPQPAVQRDAGPDNVEPTLREQQSAPIIATGNPAVELPDEGATSRSKVDSISPTDSDAPVIHRTPLDEVWPVRKIHPPAPANIEVQRAPTGQPPVTDIRPPDENTWHEAVQTALKSIAPQSPSDSTVELIPPRFPRPMRESPIPNALSSEEAPASSSEILSQPVAQGARDVVEEPIMTGIGPLPRDLWMLLGQAPPATPPQQPPRARAPETESPLPWVEATLPNAGPIGLITGKPSSTAEATGTIGSAMEQLPEALTPWATSGATSAADELPGMPAALGPTATAPQAIALELVRSGSTIGDALEKAPQSTPAAAHIGAQLAAQISSPQSIDPTFTPPVATVPFLPESLPTLDSPPVPSPVQNARAAAAQAVAIADALNPDPANGSGTSKPDIDELARRVYLDIRRRLTHEWERTRSRD